MGSIGSECSVIGAAMRSAAELIANDPVVKELESGQ
jgi:hypothetical protein